MDLGGDFSGKGSEKWVGVKLYRQNSDKIHHCIIHSGNSLFLFFIFWRYYSIPSMVVLTA